ncbi:hypothetical protein ACFL0L_02225 [Patescibacteria group bacterium]
MGIIRNLIKIILFACIIVFGASFFVKDFFPSKKNVVEMVYNDPIQTEVVAEPINQVKQEFTAEISPRYSYEIWGVVVSLHDSGSWYDYYHANDPFNSRDICVVWGKNVDSEIYKTGKYTSGDFTCYWNFNSREDYQAFHNSYISNNHLLPSNDDIYHAIKDARVGDQVHIKGYLSEYSVTNTEDGDELFERGTSTIREDTGNGACETIYVTEFNVLKKNPIALSFIRMISMYIGMGSLVVLFIIMMSTFKRHVPKE